MRITVFWKKEETKEAGQSRQIALALFLRENWKFQVYKRKKSVYFDDRKSRQIVQKTKNAKKQLKIWWKEKNVLIKTLKIA